MELESSKPCCPAPVARGLSGTSSSVHTTSPTACQVLPSPSQRRAALGSFPSLCRKAHAQWLGPARGEHLLRTPVALGLSYSTQVPPTTSILEGLGPATHQSPFWGFLLHCGRQGFVPIKEDSTAIGRSGQSRIRSEIAARLRFCGSKEHRSMCCGLPPSADSSAQPATAVTVTFLFGVCC